jgi:hypothetical protein
MSLVKRFAAASLATVALSALHAEPPCPGNIASLVLRRIQDVSSANVRWAEIRDCLEEIRRIPGPGCL